MSDKTDRMHTLIAALLAKTVENGCTEAEASAAMEKAQELLLRYNLTEAAVHARLDGDAAMRERVGMQDVTVASGFRWRALLLSACAKANLCRVVFSANGDRGTVHVFGKRENVRVVLDIWGWLCEQLERMGFAALRDYMQPLQQAQWDFHPDGRVTARPWKPRGDENEATYLAGFYKAAVSRIDWRLQEALRRFSAESDMTRALVVSSGMELETAVNTAFPLRGTYHDRGDVGRDGLRAGARAGDKVSLARSPSLNPAGGAGASQRLGAGR